MRSFSKKWKKPHVHRASYSEVTRATPKLHVIQEMIESWEERTGQKVGLRLSGEDQFWEYLSKLDKHNSWGMAECMHKWILSQLLLLNDHGDQSGYWGLEESKYHIYYQEGQAGKEARKQTAELRGLWSVALSLFSAGNTVPGLLCPVQGSPVLERCEAFSVRDSPAKGHKND